MWHICGTCLTQYDPIREAAALEPAEAAELELIAEVPPVAVGRLVSPLGVASGQVTVRCRLTCRLTCLPRLHLPANRA